MVYQILGIGCDIESISRFSCLNPVNDSGFLQKVFTDAEIKYCYSSELFAERLAVRYCAKESVVKALSDLDGKKMDYKDIEVVRDVRGKPEIFLHDSRYGHVRIYLTLSHCHDKAIAFVIAMVEETPFRPENNDYNEQV